MEKYFLAAFMFAIARNELIRVNKELKKKAFELLNSIGLNFSYFFRTSFANVMNKKKIPFSTDVPNQETIRAMQAADNGDVTRHESVSSYFKNRGKSEKTRFDDLLDKFEAANFPRSEDDELWLNSEPMGKEHL